MKAHFIVVYLLLLFAGVVCILVFGGEDRATLVATRNLPANHLLQPGDLSMLTDGKQYLRRSLKQGEQLQATELSDSPKLDLRPATVPHAVMLERARVAAGEIDAGSGAMLCPAKIKVEVRAILCGDGDSPCLAVIDIPQSEATTLTKAEPSTLSLQTDDCE